MTKNKVFFGVAINDLPDLVALATKKDKKARVYWICPAYRTWYNILLRCYSEKHRHRNPTYHDAYVCDEWLLFSNFKSWYFENYVKGYEIDKDLLVEGNRVYSPETCVFVHRKVNLFIAKGRRNCMKELPGASIEKDRGLYKANIGNPFTGKRESIGRFKTEVAAHRAWAARKTELAEQLANSEYVIDDRVRAALLARNFRKA